MMQVAFQELGSFEWLTFYSLGTYQKCVWVALFDRTDYVDGQTERICWKRKETRR